MTEQELFNAIVYLAERCDGANAEDGKGFNKADSFFGKSLASQIKAKKFETGCLSPKQVKAGAMMVKTYSRQIGHIITNFTYDDPEADEAKRQKEQAMSALPYYRGTLVGDRIEFHCQRWGSDAEYNAARAFFRDHIKASWKPTDKTGPEKARWVVYRDAVERLDGWRSLVPQNFTLDPSIAAGPEKEVAPPIQYPDIIRGTRDYQVEAILAMRL